MNNDFLPNYEDVLLPEDIQKILRNYNATSTEYDPYAGSSKSIEAMMEDLYQTLVTVTAQEATDIIGVIDKK